MNRRKLLVVTASLSFALVLALIGMKQGQAQAPKKAYPNMAPLDEYLMADRNAEIALARSAAPDAISGDAKIMVLGRHGYETAVEGKNGFVCVVERGWMSPSDSPEFWNPKLRGPICFNPPAARSVLPATLKRTEMVLAGRTKAEIIEGNKAAFEKMGVDQGRVSLLVAVMEKRVGLALSGQDLFVNVAGGVRLTEPAVDLGIALALSSSFLDRAVSADTLIFGEVGLTGEVRAVSQPELRLKEGHKLGFRRALLAQRQKERLGDFPGLELLGVDTLAAAIRSILPR